MAVEIDSSRKAVNIKWDQGGLPDGTDRVDIHTKNPETDDVSSRLDLVNDGYAVLTYPVDFTGTSHIVVVPAGTPWPPEAGDITPSEDGEVEVE